MRNVVKPVVGVALGALVVLLTSPQFAAFRASRLLQIDNLVVTPEPGSAMPLVTAERTIHRPFTATWMTTIWRQVGSGFVRFCTHDGRNDYLPEATVPERADLNWWLGVPPHPPCPPLEPGRYKVTLGWIISSDSGDAVHSVRAESNVFEIGPDPATAGRERRAASRPATPATEER